MNNNQNTRKTVSEADINLLHKADEIHNRDVKNLVLIHQVYDTGYLQRQLAEECSELAQAALKLIRAWNGESPVKENTALESYLEELADVWVMLSIALLELDDCEMNTCAAIADYKRDRLHTRLCEAAVQGRGDYAQTLEDDVRCPRERPSEAQNDVSDDEPGEDDVWDNLDAAWADMDEALTQIEAQRMEQKGSNDQRFRLQKEHNCDRCCEPIQHFVEVKSRRVQLVMQPSLYDAAKTAASRIGISFNDYVSQVLYNATRQRCKHESGDAR